MPFERDPLSVLYDDQTNLLLDKLYGNTSLPVSVDAFVHIPLDDPPDDWDGSLTKHQRAFVRSLNHQNGRRDPRGSIPRPVWHEMTLQGQRVTVTMFSGPSGADHVKQHPESSFVERPELRSSGLIPDPEE